MREEQKIILSLYYADPTAKPSNIQETKLSIGMDVVQMLFLMEGVFDEIEYKYYIADGKIQSQPIGDKIKEYQDLIEQSDPELKVAQVLAAVNNGENAFQDLDYRKIDSYRRNRTAKMAVPKDNLYFLNILVRNVNGKHVLGERNTHIFYHLFSNRKGKEFIGCLVSMMVKFISTLLKGDVEEAEKVIAVLNGDYDLMKVAYQNRKKFLENMMRHEQRMRYDYPENFFLNQSEKFRTWVKDHRDIKDEGDILKFIFYKNEALKNFTLHLMLHIVKISRIFLKDKHKITLLEKNFKLSEVLQMSEFYHLDRLIEKLEERGKDSSFDMIKWANEYNGKLYDLAKELRLL